jgi:transposase
MGEAQMDVHQNVRTTPHSREKIVRRVLSGESARAVATAVGVCESTVRKWLARQRAEGRAGLHDRSCRPHRSPTATPPALVQWIERLRRQRWTGPEIASRLRLGRTTVARLLQRRGLARLDLLTIKELGGWKSLAMVRYAHLSPEHRRNAIERLTSRREAGESPAAASSTVSSTGA